jgi:hypothetical protein
MAEILFSGGLNESDETQVKVEECISGYNFELGNLNTHFKPRKPFDLKGTSTNVGSINGFIQLIKNDNTETTLVQSGDVVYLWDGSTFTSKGTGLSGAKLRGVTWSLGGYSVITDINKAVVVKKWDGTTFGNLTTGLGSPLKAKYGIVHLGRVWLFNVTAGSDTPHLLVASTFENPELYDTSKRAKDSSFTTGNEAFFMVTPDLLPINGVSLYFGTLLISTENGRVYKLTGTGSTTFAWEPFYTGSAATGSETFANIGNDVVYMRRGGVIESLRSTQAFGDVQSDDLSRWIRTTTSGLTDSITIYDQTRQKIFFFVTDKVLVLFKDMLQTELSPWSVYKTNHASGFNTESAIYMRTPGGTTYNVYWGDSAGHIFQLEGTSDGDNGDTSLDTFRRIRYVAEPALELDNISGRVEYKRISETDLIMQFEWADDYSIATCTVPLDGPPVGDPASYFGGSAYFGGAFYFNTGFFFANRISTKGFNPVGKGPGFYLDLTISSKQLFDVIKLTFNDEG